MLSNKYQSSTNLDYTRPHKRPLPGRTDLSNFYTDSDELARLTNFGLEMMKFLPKFEQMAYAGQIDPRPNEESKVIQYEFWDNQGGDPAVNIPKTPDEMKVTPEWYDEFNGYRVSVDDLLGANGDSASGVTFDTNHDGFIDNEESIRLAEEPGGWFPSSEEGDWHNEEMVTNGLDERQNWISGQIHRQGAFGSFANRGLLGAGSGVGNSYKNLDFLAEAGEWNHIARKTNSRGANHADASTYTGKYVDQAENASLTYSFDFGGNYVYQANPYIADLGQVIPWNGVVAFTKSLGNSYYDEVMGGSYSNLEDVSKDVSDPARYVNGVKLIIAMYESRARSWEAMKELFGPVASTHYDSRMIPVVNDFLSGINKNANSHALGIAPFFLEIQHSFLNRLYTYYQVPDGSRQGLEDSILDSIRFKAFSEWAGGSSYAAHHVDKNLEGTNSYRLEGRGGVLYQYRDALWTQYATDGNGNIDGSLNLSDSEKEKLDALDKLIDNWFGGVDKTNMPRSISTTDDSETKSPTRYGWDRKYYEVDSMNDDDGGIEGTSGNHISDFADTHSHPGEDPYFGPLSTNHVNYTSAQFYRLNDIGVMQGERFENNWVVHAYGMYLKNGVALDRVKVMSRIELSRNYSQEFKKDTGDYRDRKEEIATERAQEESAAMNGQAKRRAGVNKKKGPDAIRVGSKSKAGNNNGRNSPPPPPRNNRFAATGTKAEFKKALQGLSNRLLGNSAKHKAMLAKIKKDTQ